MYKKAHGVFIWFNFILACFVLCLGGLLALDILSPSLQDSMHKKKIALTSEFKSSRDPASLKNNQDVVVSQINWIEMNRVTTINWDCKSKKTFNLSHVAQARLTGPCLGFAKSIKNLSNGYTASLFSLRKNLKEDVAQSTLSMSDLNSLDLQPKKESMWSKTISTDYISMEPGINRVVFEWNDVAISKWPTEIEISIEK